MIINPFETQLYDYLEFFFREQGYELLSNKKQFRLKTDYGFRNVIVSATPYNNETWFEIHFGIRHEQIEQLAQQFLGNSPDFWADSNTLVISTGKFNDTKYFRYKIQSNTDLADACNDIKFFFEQWGFEFMASSERLSVIHNVLNKTPSKPCKYLYNQVHRCFKGVIAARFSNHDFIPLADTYRFQMVSTLGASAEELHNFEKLLSYLLYSSVN